MAEGLETLASGGAVALLDPALPLARGAEVDATLAHAAAREPGVCSIATGGSSGEWRLARHRVETFWAAAKGFAQRFPHLKEHWSPLPVFHVSGWMPVWRAMACGGEVVPADYRQWLNSHFPRRPAEGAVLSLVPTQIHRLMEVPAAVEFLRSFACILVGGAAISDSQRARARTLEIPLAPSYGMTETAGAISVLTPASFLSGTGGCGQPLPHIHTDLQPETGRLLLQSPSLFDGYLTAQGFAGREDGPWPTTDRASLEDPNSLHILGRIDRMITCGGEKVAPARIESILRKIPCVEDVVAFGLSDPDWGEVVAVALEVSDFQTFRNAWQSISAKEWSPVERPRFWWITDQLPRNSLGKIQLSALLNERSRFTPEP
ncbi:MAG: AMP-binding protein [Opitutales bacterium]|nr:AMP-binding protein [Opitutales bacterium]